MANTFSPFGFQAFGRLEGASPTAGLTKLTLFASDANTYFTGDVVRISSAASGFGSISLPSSGSVIGSTGGTDPIAGIFAGCEILQPNVGRVVWSAQSPGNVGSSAPGFAYIIDDPEQKFLVMGSTNAVLGTSNIGQNIGFASTSQGSGNTQSGRSAEFLASSTPSAAATLPFRIVDVYAAYAPPGVNGTSTGSEGAQIMVVQFNNQYRRSLTGPST